MSHSVQLSVDGTAYGFAQVPLGCGFFAQLAEPPVAKFFFHALAEFVRLAKETPGASLFGMFAFVVHVTGGSRVLPLTVRGFMRQPFATPRVCWH